METVEEDYSRPLREVYASMPEATQVALASDIRKIWMYFFSWVVFVLLSVLFAIWFVTHCLLIDPFGERLQRIGSIIPVLAVAGEALFLVRINRLASVIHPAQLTIEIYRQRRFRPLVYVSLGLTFLFVVVGAVLSGYGDLLFENLITSDLPPKP